MMMSDPSRDRAVVLGGGLAGLSAGFFLSKAKSDLIVFEKESEPGGLARTITAGESRFDLGGHRLLTDDRMILQTVKALLGEELIGVFRKSQIYRDHRYFDYPLQPAGALRALGAADALRIAAAYCRERFRAIGCTRAPETFEEWVVSRFGRVLFDLFFREYSEKVWGVPCHLMHAELAEQRIGMLSLAMAVRHAFLGKNGSTDGKRAPGQRFFYPSSGIGRISERLTEEIKLRGGSIRLDSEIEQLGHDGRYARSVRVRAGELSEEVEAGEFISSIPLTCLVDRMHPRPPREVLAAAQSLAYRDMVVVALRLSRPRVTDQTWIYVPDKKAPFGRLHEPKNWSPKMAPEGETVLVAEHFCFAGDRIWAGSDDELTSMTMDHLHRLGWVSPGDLSGSTVVRVPNAYPIPRVGYEKAYKTITDYLGRIENLQIIGRTGRFRYLNMDKVMREGVEAARRILQKEHLQDFQQ